MPTSAGTEVIPVRRRRPSAASAAWTRLGVGLAVLIGIAVALGIAFAGSSAKLASGVQIDGIAVGGLTPKQALRLLDARFENVQRVPVVFTAGERRFQLTAVQLGIRPDFERAVAEARREGEGFGPVRGFKRLQLRFFETDVHPQTRFWDQAVRLKLAVLARRVDNRPRSAALVRTGLEVSIVPSRTGKALDQRASSGKIVAELGRLDRRGTVVALPVVTKPPAVTTARLQPVLLDARRALAAPVRLVRGATAWRLPRWRLATLLDLPADGRTSLRIVGPAADAYFAQLSKSVDVPPVAARFSVDGAKVKIVPSISGVGLDPSGSAAAILAAATRPGGDRTATLATVKTEAKMTTEVAQKMGIVGLVSSYETFYGGIPNRLHNVALVAHLVDDHLIKPGEEFSFNKTTGERSAAKGFLEAPVIVNGELQTGLGGGVCQVSTTVFNAAFEAGLSITERTNHALYISHYPLGRDATVDYPNVDLKFVNDTGHWLLLRTFVGTGSLVVNLYGTPVHRKVEVETAPLQVVGPPPVKKVKDPTLPKGEQEVESEGVPSQATSVRRKVYGPDGALMYDTTWYSSYSAEPKILRVGTKKPGKGDATTTATSTTTGTSTTPQSQTPPPATTAPGSGGR